jgi:hypothetical protein
MVGALLLATAAALPLGVWPSEVGEAAVVIDEVEFYLVEPEDDCVIVAVQPLVPALEKAEPAALKRLARLATRLGADAVLLLGELAEDRIPSDPLAPLPAGKNFSAAVFVTFDAASGWDEEPGVPGAASTGARPRPVPGRQRLAR